MKALIDKRVRVQLDTDVCRIGVLRWLADDGGFCIEGDDSVKRYGWPALEITEAPDA